jgi:short-subunit dehydrogenase
MNVVITGATKGIGRATAQTFAEGGYNIIAVSRTAKDLNEMQAEFIARYPAINFHAHAVDISNENELQGFASWLKSIAIVPDILINNAGQFIGGSIYNEAEGVLQKMMEVNLYGAYNLTRLVLPDMMARRSGHIFNICSITALQGIDKVGSYGISKFALLGFSKNLREEMKPFGIKVTAVSPGATISASWEGTGVDPNRIMEEKDVATMIFAASQLSHKAVVEDIVMRPQLGDL